MKRGWSAMKEESYEFDSSSDEESSIDSLPSMEVAQSDGLQVGKENCIGGEMIMMMHQKSIVKIEVTSKTYNHKQPWSAPIINSGSGSGFVVRYGDKAAVGVNKYPCSCSFGLASQELLG